ncbi:MAG: uracil-DNA glycosylase [Planctomycetes bacterium]|nr:uracil-DNA glycosylase [Planctomycetota bacterium]
MAEPSFLPDEEFTRQARQHLESLRAAGVEWLPWAPLPNPAPAPAPPAERPAPPMEKSEGGELFGMPAEAEQPLGSLEERRQALQVLAEKVSTCMRCPELVASRTRTVFGVGQPGVELCFVGEAPGADEDARGEPFVGAAGQLLNRIIAACKLKREDVYICNTIKCRPPGNRTPLPPEVANCHGYLDEQLALVRPKFICALGSAAAQALLNTTQSLGRLRGRFHDYQGIPVLVTYHPAYLLPHRNPDKKKDVWNDMKLLLARMGRPVP